MKGRFAPVIRQGTPSSTHSGSHMRYLLCVPTTPIAMSGPPGTCHMPAAACGGYSWSRLIIRVPLTQQNGVHLRRVLKEASELRGEEQTLHSEAAALKVEMATTQGHTAAMHSRLQACPPAPAMTFSAGFLILCCDGAPMHQACHAASSASLKPAFLNAWYWPGHVEVRQRHPLEARSPARGCTRMRHPQCL